MFCKNCGTSLPDGTMFCPNCGTRVEAEAPTTPVSENTASEFEATIPQNENTVVANEPVISQDAPTAPMSEPVAPQEAYMPDNEAPVSPENFYGDVPPVADMPKKKNKKILWGSVGVAAVAVITAVALFLTGVFGGGKKTTKKVLLSAEKNATSSLLSNMVSIKDIFDNNTLSAQFTVDISDDAAQLLGQLIDAPLSGGTFGVNCDLTVDVDEYRGEWDLELTSGGSTVLTAQLVADLKNKEVYFSLPEINKTPIKVDLKDMLDEVDIDEFNDSLAELQNAIGDLEDMVDKLPDPEKVVGIIDDVFEAAVDALGDLKTTDGTLKVNGVSQKCSKCEIEITAKTVLNVAKSVLKELKNNSDLRTIVEDLADITEGEVDSDELFEGIDEAYDQLQSIKAGDLGEIPEMVLTFWIDGNDLIGIDFNMDDDGDELALRAACAKDGKEIGLDISATQDNRELAAFTGTGTLSDDLLTGDFTLAVQEETYLKVKTADFGEKNGAPTGSVTLSLGKGAARLIDSSYGSLLTGVELTLEFSGNKNERGIEISLGYSGAKMLSLSAKVALIAKKNITAPSGCIDADDDYAMQQWESESLQSLSAIAGKFDADSLLGNLFESIIGSDDYDDYDDYYDDYDDYDDYYDWY